MAALLRWGSLLLGQNGEAAAAAAGGATWRRSADSEAALAHSQELHGDYVDEGLVHDRRVSIESLSEAGLDAPAGAGGWRGADLPAGWFSWRRLWRFMGPGFLMSIAYIDPGNLESDLQAGARTGYTLLWVLAWSTAMGYLLQMLAAKLGVATGMHLAQHCRAQYPRAPRLSLWIMTEVAIIGSDIQEVIGSAIAIFLLTGGAVPLWAGVLVTAVDSFALLLVERLGVRHLEALFGALISVMAASFGVMYFMAGVPTSEVAKGLVVPRLPRAALGQAVAVIGAVIMPHNIYLHSALVNSRKIDTSRQARKKEAMAYYSIESAIALAVSLFINVAVVSVFADGFYGKGDKDIGLENAGKYLGDAFGSPMTYIWAVGLLAAGQASTMTGTYAGQFVMSGFLNLHVSQSSRILLTRSVAIAPTLLVALLYRDAAGTQLDTFNQWINVLQSIQLPFALIPVLTMTSSERIMGKAFKNPPLLTAFAWAIAAAVLAVNVSLLGDFVVHQLPRAAWAVGLFGLLATFYVALIAYLVLAPRRWSQDSDATDKQLGSSWAARDQNGAAAVTAPLIPHDDTDGSA